MVVQHNMQAMNANRMLGVTTSSQAKSTEKLSSGYKINRAADDAAGLTISEKMRKQIRGLDRASTNAQDGVSAVQTAEGALTEVHSMLQRMNELATQAANGTNSEPDRDAIQAEIDQLATEIDRVAETTKFNETYLLKGNEAGVSTEKKINAHDAGVKGKLVDNGSTAKFSVGELADGDKIKIAGEEYTIGSGSGSAGKGGILKPKEMNTDTSAYVDLGTAADFSDKVLAVGDSFTVDGETFTLTNKISLDELTLDATNGEFKIGNEYYKVAAAPNNATNDGTTAAKAIQLTDADARKKIEEALKNGDQVLATNFKADDKTGADAASVAGVVGTGAQVVLEYEKNEVSVHGMGAATGWKLVDLAEKANGGAVTLKAGDSYTTKADGETKTAVASPEAAKDVYDDIDALVKDDFVTIGTGTSAKTYTIVDDADVEDAGAYNLHKDTILSMIHDGDVVNYTGAGNAVTVIGDIGTPAGNDSTEKTISAADAYAKIAEELQKASSIGTDEGKAASVESDGKGNFTITKGSTMVQEDLSFNLHVGADADMTNKIGVTIEAMDAASLGIKGLDVIGKDADGRNINDGGIAATYAIDAIADAISKVSAQRSALGAVQNRLEHTIANLDNVVENTTAAESRIRDTDMAEEMVEYSKNNILAQAGQSMLAQANQSTQGVLSLLQ